VDAPVHRHHVRWEPCFRVIPTRYPRISLFEDVATPEELETVGAIYALGNDRIREELGLLHRVPPEDRIAGPGTAYIMAAFTHINPLGSRFSDGSYGVFYAARALETAVVETQYHLARFLTDGSVAAGEFDQRVLEIDLNGLLHSIRGRRRDLAAIYDPASYAASQPFGRRLRERDSLGIVYDSVRHRGGVCAGVFRPPVLSNCRERSWLCYVWDGREFTHTYEKRPLEY